MKPPRADAKEIARTIAALYQPGDVIEVRIPKTPQGTISGYFDDLDELAGALARINGNYPGVYTTLNPCNPALLARSANHTKPRAMVTTNDADILRRRKLLIDCDPVRPADISSTDAEHDAAIERAREIRAVLAEEGWPAPILADSGNGAHLIYTIDLPNDAASESLVKHVLKALAARFDDGVVKIDQTVFNAARISKAYGTVARKGDDIPARPHRLSRILDEPMVPEPVSRELLEELTARYAPAVPRPEPRPAWARQRFDIDAFLGRYLKARAPVAHEGGRKWVLEECPFNPEHKAPDSAVFEHSDGSLGFKCFHNSCANYGWKDLRVRFDPPRARAPRSEPEDDTEPEGEPPLTGRSWPEPMRPEAFHGIAGEVVRQLDPHTESDPAALLMQTLVAWGSLIGRGPYYLAEADRHFTNLYTVIVGLTAKGRKGTSLGRVRGVLSTVDEPWADNCLLSGLGSGEGLVDTVGTEGADKRCLIIEPELARLLAVLSREGCTLSPNLRDGWDSGLLAIRTRHTRIKVQGVHLSLIGHITRDELLRKLDNTELANGLCNRMLWVCARRSKELPHGGGWPELGSVSGQFAKATEFARRLGQTRVQMNHDAKALWESEYHDLSEGRPGLLGAVTSRSEAQVVRLSLIYALLDCADQIRIEHLRAALAVWAYCDASCRYVWGDLVGDPLADQIQAALRRSPGGLSRTEIRDLLGRNYTREQIGLALLTLAEYGRARMTRETTGARGRPEERWFAA